MHGAGLRRMPYLGLRKSGRHHCTSGLEIPSLGRFRHLAGSDLATDDVLRNDTLGKEEQRKLHDEITKQGLDCDEIVEVASEMFP